MLEFRRLSILGVLLAATASSSFGITYIVPTDRDLVHRASAIIVATAVESHAQFNAGGGIVTVSSLRVDRVLKGPMVDGVIQLTHPGGSVGVRWSVFPGSPRYENGKKYLVFLEQRSGQWQTYGWGIGKFQFLADLHGRELLVRASATDELFGVDEKDWTPHVEPLRGAPEFMNFVEAVVESGTAMVRTDYIVPRSEVTLTSFGEFHPRAEFKVIPTATRPDYMFFSGGYYRWSTPTATFVYCCGATPQPGFDGPGAAASGVANWNGAGAGINYSLGARDDTANSGFTPDGKNAILFDDPNNEVPSGAAAIGGINNVSGSYTLSDGQSYFNTTEADVVVAKNVSTNQATFTGVLTHELGHTLGFRHADGTSNPSSPPPACAAPAPCAGVGQAVMAHIVNFNMSSLGPQWDSDAANTVYGTGPPPCTPPNITLASANPATITSGNSTTLSATATGTGPLSYQWYIGSPGNTSQPAGSSGASISVSPSTTTNYWVRVTGQCSPPGDSGTVTVTVQQPQCQVPANVTAFANPASISPGGTTLLSVNSNGTPPFTYQWFVGDPPGTIINGATSASIQVSDLNSTTKFFAQVSNACGGPINSNVVTVTVGCENVNISQAFATPSSITPGGTTTLRVNATGTSLTYQWYFGEKGNTSNPVSGATGVQFSANLNQTTTFWVRVNGQCGGPVDSDTITVTVVAQCVDPNNAVATGNPLTIAPGGTSTLSATANGTGLTYQWFSGTPPGTAINGATSPTLPVQPASTTTYFVRVSGQCGTPINSNNVTVTVSAACVDPSIATQPANKAIFAGTTATLSVGGAGTAPLHYQWFEGATGDTSKPRGTDSATFTSAALMTKTQFWVRVSGNCGQPVFSNTATVDVKGARPRPVRH